MIELVALCVALSILGEVLRETLSLPLPGPLVGLGLLLCWFGLRRGVPARLGAPAEAILPHIALFLIPAGVGVLPYLPRLGPDLVPVLATIVASTLLGMAAAGLTMQILVRRRRPAIEADTVGSHP